MPPKSSYAPKHAAPRTPKVRTKALRTTLLLTSVAAATTGVAVGGGVVSGLGSDAEIASASITAPEASAAGGSAAGVATDNSGETAAAAPSTDESADESTAIPELSEEQRAERAEPEVSRSDRRTADAAEREATLSADSGDAVTVTDDMSDDDPREIAKVLLGEFGFGQDQFSCLDSLYMSESGWRVDADNPTSSAYGIPQALTGLHDLPADYMTSAEAQIRWGLEYIQNAYGTPCSAWSFKQSNNWY